ncbi:MAG: hypothetical protein HDT44_06360 [Ruminococcaceae bacterium]|nr:hypothetical protein [Oscillospiraceae bacterium]
MSQAKNYIELLQKREPELFPQPLKSSSLTDTDIADIEKGLGYALPEDYSEFLQSCQMPKELTVIIGFCGDAYAASFSETYSKEAKGYIPVPDDDIAVFTELEWHNITAEDGEEFLKILKEEQYPDNDNEAIPALLKAGFLKIAEFDGYIIYLDLVQGCLYSIYHEELHEMSIVDGVDNTNIEEVREYMENNTPLCNNFGDFLQVVCTGKILNENDGSLCDPEELQDIGEEYEGSSEFFENPSGEMFFGIPRESFEKGFKLVPKETGMSIEETIEFMAELMNISKEQCREVYDKLKGSK